MSEKFDLLAPCRVAVEVCRLALARGTLTRDGSLWRFGRRGFSNETVKCLIDEGVAVREGDTVTRLSSSGNASMGGCTAPNGRRAPRRAQ